MTKENKIRQPIITVAGHVDHGKTSILDCFRGSSVQEGEAGGITQKISFTKYPLEQIYSACPLIKKNGVLLDIPGFLFIDTPGHAAFTNLRKRGGSLSDLAILVVNIKEGIKPQTAEVLQILKTHKTPFLIALNKIDNLSGWRKGESIKDSIDRQAIGVRQEFDECLMTFQASLQEHGFESALYYEIEDFTKQVAIVPCSAKTKEGISELIFVLCGLCQKFLMNKLKTAPEAKGVILEMKKDRGMEWAEAILYDGILDEGDELVIASFGEPVISKVRSIEEILPLSNKYLSAKSVRAATGVRMQLTNKEGILPGMPFQEVSDNLNSVMSQFKKDISGAIKLDKNGIIIKADSLGSLEALIVLLKQEKINILKAGIGHIGKSDIISARANLSIEPLDSAVVGFNVSVEEDVEVPKNIKIFTNPIIYKLIEDLTKWRNERQAEILKEKLLELATISKIEILSQYLFRNSNPAIFGVRILSGKIRTGLPIIDENGKEIARIKSIQYEKATVLEAKEGQEICISMPGTTFDRQLKDVKFLYANLSESQFKQFKKNKDLLSNSELKTLQEIADIKRKSRQDWGI